MESRSKGKRETFAKNKGSTLAWGGDLCQLLSAEENDKVPHLRRKASDSVACQMYHACRVLSRMRDMVILIHGPRGCAQTLSLYTKFFDGFKMQGKAMDHPMRVECSNLDENDVVFGGADRLRHAILDADRRYHPSFIPIVETCVPGMIGDDMDAVAAEVQRVVQAKLIVLHVPGFRAVNPADGVVLVCRTLAKNVMEAPNKVRKDQVNIWGYESDPWVTSSEHDCGELLRLLRELGLEGKFFFGGATIEDLRRAPEAILNIPCRPGHCRGVFEEMENRFGSACVTTEQASSTEMTKRWLRAIGRGIGLEDKVETLIEQETARIAPQLEQYRKRLEGKTVAIHAVHDYTVPLLWLVAVDLGMVPTYVGIRYFDNSMQSGMREIQQHLGTADLKVVVNAARYEDEIVVSQLVKPDVYIGNLDYIPNMFAYEQPTVLMNGYHHVGPHMGFSGVLQLAREITWAIENPFARKVVPYALLNAYSSEAWVKGSPLLAGVTLDSITS